MVRDIRNFNNFTIKSKYLTYSKTLARGGSELVLKGVAAGTVVYGAHARYGRGTDRVSLLMSGL